MKHPYLPKHYKPGPDLREALYITIIKIGLVVIAAIIVLIIIKPGL